MTLSNLIKKKDYDFISIRITMPKHISDNSVFMGAAKSINGKLLPLDGDAYDENEEVLMYEEWSCKERGINNGLTVVFKGNWKNNTPAKEND